MPGISRVGLDTAGGLIVNTPQTFFTVEGALVALVGSAIADHGGGSHNSANMAEGSDFLTVNGFAAVLAGHAADCGHLATGSSFCLVSG